MPSKITTKQKEELLKRLEERFNNNMNRHKGMKWEDVAKRLTPEKIASLYLMEDSGGDPDVVDYDKKSGKLYFFDCSKETPKGRVNLCYDRKALEGRKKFPPKNCAMDVANECGIELLNEDQYRYLQTKGEFDLKTSSWILTPEKVRNLGGAFFCDRRYDTVFTYHNGADSYYGVRGFRGMIEI